MQDIMLDLETMGTSANAAIVAIGAVEFDPLTNSLGREFYVPVDLKSAVDHGGTIDPDTVMWWMKQSDAARALFNESTGIHIQSALQRFAGFIENTGSVRIWGNGAAFDNVILAEAYKRSVGIVPWKFWNDRCYRTVKNMYPHITFQHSGTAHNALHDARAQAEHLIKIFQEDSV